MRTPDEFDELKRICPGAKEMPEASIDFILLPDLKISGQGQVDGLLCPQARDGYPTRLFLSKEVPGKGNNWTTHRILDRTWWTWSWKDVSADLRLAEILAAHISALR
jgi:hypothetical protein